MEVMNTPAYYNMATITTVKSFVVKASGEPFLPFFFGDVF
jgi:hypothetical protein